MTTTAAGGTLDEAVRAIGDHEGGYIVATHQNPDGDAIGSLLAFTRLLRAQGRDVVMWHPHVPAVPGDLAFLLQRDEVVSAELPADAGDRLLIALDCASESRLTGGAELRSLAGSIVNIDHHHDNGRFGDVNHIDAAASSASEIVAVLAERAGWPITREVAEPLHVGIVTDTGRFSYSNVTPATFAVAGRLAATGIDIAELGRRLYENTPLANARLLGTALAGARPLLGGRLLVGVLTADDFALAGTDETDGIAEALRGVGGVVVSASIRPVEGGQRVSLRASDSRVDVSDIAHLQGGGGHRAAAGLTMAGDPDAVVAWLEDEVGRRLDAGAPE